MSHPNRTPTGASATDSDMGLLRTYGRTDGLTEKLLTHRSHGSSTVLRTRVRRTTPTASPPGVIHSPCRSERLAATETP
jgi:hypothetical protein